MTTQHHSKKKNESKTYLAGSRIEKYYNKIVVGFIFLTAILVLAIVYFSFSKTTILVQTHEVPLTAEVTKTVTDLGGTIFLTEVEGNTASQNITGTTEKPAKAQGTVTIYNKYSKAQPLVATTRLLSTGGVLFRTKETVTVSAGGSVQVGVEADQEGVSGNIGPSQFEIVALWEGLKKDIYAESTAAMAGGLTTAGTVKESDINELKNALNVELLQKAKEQFEAEIKRRTDLPAKPLWNFDVSKQQGIFVNYLTNEVSAKEGDVVENFTAHQKIQVVVPVFDTAVMQTVVPDILKAQLPAGTEMILDQLTSSWTVTSVNEDRTEAEILWKLQVPTKITTNHKILDRGRLTGLTEMEIKKYLEAFPEVAATQVKFSPFWVTRTPNLIDHIIIQID